MSGKSSALILIHRQRRFKKILEHDVDAYEQKKKGPTLQLQIENRYKIEVLQGMTTCWPKPQERKREVSKYSQDPRL